MNCFIIDSVGDLGEAYTVPRQGGMATRYPALRSDKVCRARPASRYHYRMHPESCWCWSWPAGAVVMQTIKQITTSQARLKPRNLAAMLLYAQDFGGCSARVSRALVGNQIDCP